MKFNFLKLSTRSQSDLDFLFLLCKKGVSKDLIEEFYEQKQVFNRFMIGSIIVGDDVLNSIRRTLRKLSPGLKITSDDIQVKITESILKREILESDSGIEAQKQYKKYLAKEKRKKLKANSTKANSI